MSFFLKLVSNYLVSNVISATYKLYDLERIAFFSLNFHFVIYRMIVAKNKK